MPSLVVNWFPEVSHQFPNTAKALKRYDAAKVDRDRTFDQADTDEKVADAIKADLDAEHRVQDAFWEDTKDINSQDHCRVAAISFLRALVKHFGPSC